MAEISPCVHLHTHSHYSLLLSLSDVDDLVKRAKKEGMRAIALTDYHNLYGAIDFYKACKKADIKPIIGLEVTVAPRSRHDKDSRLDDRPWNVVLLAQNEVGYKNIITLVTLSHLEGFYKVPRIDMELLQTYNEGLFCLSGAEESELFHALISNDVQHAKTIAQKYKNIFGANYRIQLSGNTEIEDYATLKKNTIELARELSIPLVATCDIRFLNPDDREAYDTLRAIGSGTQVDIFRGRKIDYSFKDSASFEDIFRDIPEAIAETITIADACELDLPIGKFVFPNFPIPEGKTADELLSDLAFQGLKDRGLGESQEAIDRLTYELGIIKFKGYASYFLVVEDLIRYARKNGIYYNIRGSVAGSITTYSLKITAVDPLEYKIPFERFLNPERPSAPDIDMDFADNRRDEIIEYAKQVYGADKVAQIGTFGTMMARGAVRDVARALGYPYMTGDRISKMIPMGSQGFPMTIDHALEIVPELKEAEEKERDVRDILSLARKIEGSARHISVHAAGVVISPKPLREYTPTQMDPKGESLITQYDMYSVGEDGVGLTKFDFLGLRNLAILSDAVHLVEKLHTTKIDLDVIPLNDKKTFELLATGQTEGLFQLNGDGMTRWLKELRPTTIHDINAMVALYRPGPMQFIPDYIARKHKPSLVTYLDPVLEPILKQTYGVLVYQDDLLIMAHDLAGYSWGEVDKFRKAVGKKIPEEMAAQKEKFIKGCVEHSKWSKEKATQIWTWIEPFAAYGFNKAHSASYGRVAYQTAYMKANFPVEYMTAILTAESGNIDTITKIIIECKKMHIPVLAPDVNESFGEFTVSEHESYGRGIRFGLYTIKNLGTDISDAIVAERVKNGKYTSLEDLLIRISHKGFNKKSLESLAKSGALDALEKRETILENIEALLSFYKLQHTANKHQDSLFASLATEHVPGFTLKQAVPLPAEQTLSWEKELLGVYLSGHPLDRIQDKLKQVGTSIESILEKGRDKQEITVGVLLEEIRMVMTKKGKRMAFLRLSDTTGSIEAVVFPEGYETYRTLLQEGAILAIQGNITIRNNEKSIAIDRLKVI